jgi:hypothetical protein
VAVDIVGYLETTGIDIKYSGENVGSNDVAIRCPWCDDPSYHLTIHRTKGYLNCWRCQFDDYKMHNKKGWAPNFKALIKELEGCSWSKAKEIWEDIGGESADGEEWETVQRVEECKLPEGCYKFDDPGPFTGVRDFAFKYLLNRRFTKYHIEKYNLHFTATGYYMNRIIVPIYIDGVLVNWLGRRFVGTIKARYLNCKLADCTTRLAEMVYGQEDWSGGVVRLVEGAFDRMRIGATALALNRSQFSRKQRNVVAYFSKQSAFTSIILDPEAESRSWSIAEELSPFVRRIKLVELPEGTDPASLAFEDILKAESKAQFLSF